MRTIIALLFTFLAVKAGLAQGFPSDYIGYYSFDNHAQDLSGNLRHGTEHGNTLAYVDGLFGKAVEFNNVDHGPFDVNDYLSFPELTSKNFTVSFWAKYRNTSYDEQGGTCMLFSYGNTKLDTAFHVHHKRDWHGVRAEMVSLYGSEDDTDLTYYSTNSYFIPDSQWVHITASFDSTSIRIYLNGQLMNEQYHNTWPEFRNKPFFLAYHEWHEVPYNASRYNGLIDEMYVYDHSLSSQQVELLFESQSATAVLESRLSNPLHIYPNPVLDIAHLRIPISESGVIRSVRLYDNTGRPLMGSYEKEGRDFLLDLGHLSAGVYHVEMVFDERIYTGTVVKY